MNEITIREPQPNAIPALREIWNSVFGDIGVNAFFRLLYDPKLCIVADFDGSPVAMGYLIPSGEIIPAADNSGNPSPVKCAMIYSVATLPEYRGKGLGAMVVRKLIERAYEYDFPAVVLCPHEDGLFEYYSTRTVLCDFFYVVESILKTAPDSTRKIIPVEVSISEYYNIREYLLKDITHIRFDLRALEYQAELCKESDGGFYKIGDSCAVVERQPDETIWVKELLIPDTVPGGLTYGSYANDIIASIADKYPADEYIIRSSSRIGERRRFGMLTISDSTSGLLGSHGKSPWYGVAFD